MQSVQKKTSTMTEYRFHLQKYKTGCKTICPSCNRNRCFTRYVDEDGKVKFPGSVGKCDHDNSCGYHYTPREYFKDNPKENKNDCQYEPYKPKVMQSPAEYPPSFIDNAIMEKSKSHYDINPLFIYIKSIFGESEAGHLFDMYNVGTSSKWGGSTVYWQVDNKRRVRTGKVMLYDSKTGRRVKEPCCYVSWAHAEMKFKHFNLKQCLFGEHLLSTQPEAKVMIAESEKTAIIATHFMPSYVWLATGGKNGCFKSDVMSVLHGRDVILIPDLGATEQWTNHSKMLSICHSVVVSNIIETNATTEQRAQGLDIADFLLMEETKQMILQKMIERDPTLQKLIDAFDLVIVEED